MGGLRAPGGFVFGGALLLFLVLCLALIWLWSGDPAGPLKAAVALLAVVAVLATTIAVRLTLWRGALDGGQTSIVPDRLLAELDQETAAAQAARDASLAAFQKIGERVADMAESLAVFQSSLTLKDADLERMRQGGDAQVFRRFLGRFIRVHEALDAEIEDLRARGGDTAAMEAVRDLFEDALFDCGLEPLAPAVGADYRTSFGVAERPRRRETDDPERHFQIAEVLNPGFQLATPDGPKAIRPADVAIYIHTAPNEGAAQ